MKLKRDLSLVDKRALGNIKSDMIMIIKDIMMMKRMNIITRTNKMTGTNMMMRTNIKGRVQKPQ